MIKPNTLGLKKKRREEKERKKQKTQQLNGCRWYSATLTDRRLIRSSSENLAPAADGKKYWDLQLHNTHRERHCITQSPSNPSAQSSGGPTEKEMEKSLRVRGAGEHQENKALSINWAKLLLTYENWSNKHRAAQVCARSSAGIVQLLLLSVSWISDSFPWSWALFFLLICTVQLWYFVCFKLVYFILLCFVVTS